MRPASVSFPEKNGAYIGDVTAAVLVAKIVAIDRFETAENLVGYFGVFPQEFTSGVDRNSKPRRGGKAMSQKGNNLARRYLFCAARARSPTTRPLRRSMPAYAAAARAVTSP